MSETRKTDEEIREEWQKTEQQAQREQDYEVGDYLEGYCDALRWVLGE